MEGYYVWFSIFVFCAYLIVTDQSVAKAVDLTFKLVRSRFDTVIWWLKNNPSNPIIKYFIWRKSMKLAEELRKEFEQKRNNNV